MGTSYAGVSGADGTRLAFYCGDPAAARANPAIVAGPYLMAVLPKTQLKDALPSAIEIVADGRATRVPVKAQAGMEEVELTWTPSRDFGVSEMHSVVMSLREAQRIEKLQEQMRLKISENNENKRSACKQEMLIIY